MSRNENSDGRRAVVALTSAVALLGFILCMDVLQSWGENGPLTPASYLAAGLMYVVAPAAFSFKFINKHIKAH